MTKTQPETGPDGIFQAYLAEGRFMIQRGVDSGRHVYFPRSVSPGTGEALEWVEASGLGTVYATTAISRRPPEPALNIALIDLDEGPRMMSRVEGIDARQVRIGMRVKASIRDCEIEEGVRIVVFAPVESAA